MTRLLLLLSLVLPGRGLAWGVAGHLIVADIAERHLSPAALAQIQELLAPEGLTHLDQVATWADEIRSTRKEAAPWHYVDIPLDATGYQPGRDCPHGDCVIDAIRRYSAILADRGQPESARREALKFVVHFVADLHQPLHATENAGDQGGNKVIVQYLDPDQPPLTLHRLWDSSLIERRLGLSEGVPGRPNPALRQRANAMAAQLDDSRAGQPGAALDLDPVDWAMESHDLAASVVYPGVVAPGAVPPSAPVLIDEAYDRRAWPVITRRLTDGGLRLAALLNRDLAP
jgi:hypothetical protein